MKEKIISKTKYVEHVVRTAIGYSNEAIKLPRGGQVLPYFKDTGNVWHVVLVNQYRMALKKNTLEAAGGIIDESETPREALSRELKEETGIRIKSRSIKIIFEEYPMPSLVDSRVFGGIVEIKIKMVKNKKKAGNEFENERTQVEVFDLIEILKNRDNGLVILDLMTSRLVDEVAKAVGLLVKKY